MPALWESLVVGSSAWLGLLFFRPAWAWGFLYGFLIVFGTRLLFTRLALLRPELLGLTALGKQLLVAGLAIAGVLLGLNPIGVALGLFVWPLSLWVWAARHVRHSR